MEQMTTLFNQILDSSEFLKALESAGRKKIKSQGST
jgi:hypothetical protein